MQSPDFSHCFEYACFFSSARKPAQSNSSAEPGQATRGERASSTRVRMWGALSGAYIAVACFGGWDEVCDPLQGLEKKKYLVQ